MLLLSKTRYLALNYAYKINERKDDLKIQRNIREQTWMRSRLKNLNKIAATVSMALMENVNHLLRNTGNVTERNGRKHRDITYQQNIVQHLRTSGFNAHYHNKQTKILLCIKIKRKEMSETKKKWRPSQSRLGPWHELYFNFWQFFFYFSFIEYRFHFSYHVFWLQFLLPNFFPNTLHILSHPNPPLFFLSLGNRVQISNQQNQCCSNTLSSQGLTILLHSYHSKVPSFLRPSQNKTCHHTDR